MAMRTRRRFLPGIGAAIVCVGCGAQPAATPRVSVPVSALPTPGASPRQPAPPDSAAPSRRRARYAPRPSREGMFMEQEVRGKTAKMFGPIANNFDVRTNAELGDGTTGIVERGRRHLLANDVARPIETEIASVPILVDGVIPVPRSFGGGFVFFATEQVYFAPRFDAPVIPLGSGPIRSFLIGPRCAFLKMVDGSSKLVELASARAIGGMPPDVVSLRAHTNGFLLGLTQSASGPSTHVYFTSDVRTWKKLAIAGARDMIGEDGDALLVVAENDRVMRVGRDGKPVVATLSSADVMMKVAAEMGGGIPAAPVRAPAGGALLAHGWVPSSRRDDEWFMVREGQLYVTRGTELRKVGAALPSDPYCAAIELARQPMIMCAEPGVLFQAFRLDLDTGARVLEREVRVTQGVARHIGPARNNHPSTLLIAASCDGRADAGMCVRADDGTYRTFDLPPSSKGQVFVFPGEVIHSEGGAGGALELRRIGTPDHVVLSAEAMKPLNVALKLDPPPTQPFDVAFTTTGVLRVQGAVRVFHGPSPFRPAPSPAMNHAIDLPLDGSTPRLLSVQGTIAAAGTHALRLEGGKLYESADGWVSWHEIAPPPTGVPVNLDGAMCDERGCLFGAWARVGWDRDPPVIAGTRGR